MLLHFEWQNHLLGFLGCFVVVIVVFPVNRQVSIGIQKDFTQLLALMSS